MFVCFKLSYFVLQRDTAEEDLKPEDYQLFQGLASACLTRGDVARLQGFLLDKANEVHLTLYLQLLLHLFHLLLLQLVLLKVTCSEPCIASLHSSTYRK